jgi:hypothetical protein
MANQEVLKQAALNCGYKTINPINPKAKARLLAEYDRLIEEQTTSLFSLMGIHSPKHVVFYIQKKGFFPYSAELERIAIWALCYRLGTEAEETHNREAYKKYVERNALTETSHLALWEEWKEISSVND